MLPEQIGCIFARMTFKSLPLAPREIKATEARLQAIYDAAKLGLKGDRLALAAGMLPTEYRRLVQMDPVAEMAELKGAADGERDMAQTVYTAALQGDSRAAMDMLKHRHDWMAKQAVSVELNQTISIISALEQAGQRVINMGTIAEAPTSGNSSGLLTNDERASHGYPNSNDLAAENAAQLRR